MWSTRQAKLIRWINLSFILSKEDGHLSSVQAILDASASRKVSINWLSQLYLNQIIICPKQLLRESASEISIHKATSLLYGSYRRNMKKRLHPAKR